MPFIKAVPLRGTHAMHGGHFVYTWLGFLIEMWQKDDIEIYREPFTFRDPAPLGNIAVTVDTTHDSHSRPTQRSLPSQVLGWALFDGFTRVFDDIFGPYAPLDAPGPPAVKKPAWHIPAMSIKDGNRIIGRITTTSSSALNGSSMALRDTSLGESWLSMHHVLHLFVIAIKQLVQWDSSMPIARALPQSGLLMRTEDADSKYRLEISMYPVPQLAHLATFGLLVKQMREKLIPPISSNQWVSRFEFFQVESGTPVGCLRYGSAADIRYNEDSDTVSCPKFARIESSK